MTSMIRRLFSEKKPLPFFLRISRFVILSLFRNRDANGFRRATLTPVSFIGLLTKGENDEVVGLQINGWHEKVNEVKEVVFNFSKKTLSQGRFQQNISSD